MQGVTKYQQRVASFRETHLDHVELGDAVLVHTHRHGYAVLFDEHGVGGGGRERGREG